MCCIKFMCDLVRNTGLRRWGLDGADTTFRWALQGIDWFRVSPSQGFDWRRAGDRCGGGLPRGMRPCAAPAGGSAAISRRQSCSRTLGGVQPGVSCLLDLLIYTPTASSTGVGVTLSMHCYLCLEYTWRCCTQLCTFDTAQYPIWSG